MKRVQLFLLHYAGGNRYSFQCMLPFLRDYEVIPIELPGRGNRINESLIRDSEIALQDIFIQIMDKLTNSRFILYGHSMGAIFAFRVAGMLEQMGKIPSHLFVSGRYGPNLNNEKRRHLLDEQGLIKELIEFGGVPMEVLNNRDFLDYYMPIIRADFELVDNSHLIETAINSPIFAMMGNKEENVDKISNWKSFTKSSFDSKIFEGGHFFIYDHCKEISDILLKN